MKANQNLAIVGVKVLLVPYSREHVERYHEWMLDRELRELTASEPLSLEEEYEMQRKWQEDEDKLTFIILARDEQATEGHSLASVRKSVCEGYKMIGDVNLFLKGLPSDESFETEMEVMIAEKPFRRKGFAFEALQLLLSFATSFRDDSSTALPISADKFVVRIGDKNGASRALFEKLGFVVTKHVEVFNEIEMRLDEGGNASQKDWKKGTLVELEPDVLS